MALKGTMFRGGCGVCFGSDSPIDKTEHLILVKNNNQAMIASKLHHKNFTLEEVEEVHELLDRHPELDETFEKIAEDHAHMVFHVVERTKVV